MLVDQIGCKVTNHKYAKPKGLNHAHFSNHCRHPIGHICEQQKFRQNENGPDLDNI